MSWWESYKLLASFTSSVFKRINIAPVTAGRLNGPWTRKTVRVNIPNILDGIRLPCSFPVRGKQLCEPGWLPSFHLCSDSVRTAVNRDRHDQERGKKWIPPDYWWKVKAGCHLHYVSVHSLDPPPQPPIKKCSNYLCLVVLTFSACIRERNEITWAHRANNCRNVVACFFTVCKSARNCVYAEQNAWKCLFIFRQMWVEHIILTPVLNIISIHLNVSTKFPAVCK